MKQAREPKKWLPWAALVLGSATGLLRLGLYRLTLDSWGLVSRDHLLAWLMWLTAAAAGVLILATLPSRAEPEYRKAFPPSKVAGLGWGALALGILVTVSTRQALIPGTLGGVWQVLGKVWTGLGWAAATAAGIWFWQRSQGRRPGAELAGVVCLFFIAHVIDHYRQWSSTPQAASYVFDLLGVLCMALFAYSNAGYAADLGNRRLYWGSGLAGIVCCAGAMTPGDYPWLYLGCIVWAVTQLIAFRSGQLPQSPPTPEPEKEPDGYESA